MIWIAAGTEEGRRIAKALAEKDQEIMVSVTTEYGGSLLRRELEDQARDKGTHEKTDKTNNKWKIIDHALDYQAMERVLEEYPITKIVDATHPYADLVSKNLIALAEENAVSYFRYERGSLKELIQKEIPEHKKDVLWVKNTEEAIEALSKSRGNVLLTTGSKTLGDYLDALEVSRIYARVLPVPKVMEKCKALGLPPGQILGMQGPFSTAFNRSTLKEYNIESLVTKDSGLTGGVPEKIQGALEAKVQMIIIDRPAVDYPRVFSDIETLIEQL